MWCINYNKEMTLHELLIMAYMNALDASAFVVGLDATASVVGS